MLLNGNWSQGCSFVCRSRNLTDRVSGCRVPQITLHEEMEKIMGKRSVLRWPLGLWVAFLLVACLRLGAEAATITDADGRTVRFDQPFRRIVSLYAAHTENCFALGLDQEVIGVGRTDDYPPAKVAVRPRFSYREDAERIIAARPDLVLVRPMISRGYPAFIDKLRRAGIVTVSLQPRSVEEMFAYWRTLGLLTGRQEAAEEMIRRFQEGLAAIRRRVATVAEKERKRVYFEAIHRKMKTFSPTSMAIFCLEAAGGINVAADARSVRATNIAAYGKERILARGEEIDVFLAQVGRMNRVTREQILAEPGFTAIKAVRRGAVYLIDERLVSRPTLRLLLGIERIASLLYPSLALDGAAG